MKQKWIDAYMDTAERFAQLSSATRLKVGAVVVKDNRIISIGYNGMPSGWTNECEEAVTPSLPYIQGDGPTLRTKDEVIHAEENAITKLARSSESGENSTLFCTHAPCIQCAKLIYSSGISSVYYRQTYRDTRGVDFLEKCGVEVHREII